MSKPKKPFFSILLPTFNRLYNIKDLVLPSLDKQTCSDYELIIIDDCSNDGTNEYFTTKIYLDEFKNVGLKVSYYKNKKNLGSPSTRNVGFDVAKGEWIFMIEDDIEIKDPSFLEKSKKIIKKLSDENSKIKVISPMRIEVGTKGYYKNFNNQFVNYGVLSKEIYLDPTIESSGFVDNTHACSFIKTDITKRIKYNSKDYHYFREESDFYEKIKSEGSMIYYLGKGYEIFHRMDLSKKGGNRKHSNSKIFDSEFKYIKSHYIFLKQHFNVPQIRIVFFILIRLTKHFSNLLNLHFIKNYISKFKI